MKGKRIVLYSIIFFFVSLFITYLLNNTFMTTLVFVLGGVIFYFPIFCAWKILGIDEMLKNINKRDIAQIIIIYILLAGVIYTIINHNKFVYYWDYSGYWCNTVEYSKLLWSDWKEVIIRTVTSINLDEYNVFPCIPLGIFMQILGTDYLTYILLIYILFFTPLSVSLILTFNSLARTLKFKYCIILPCLIILLCPFFIHPILAGYLDIAGLLPISGLILLYINYDHTKFNVKKNLLIAILLIESFIIRRWYVFFVLAFIIIFAIQSIYINIKNKTFIIFIKNYASIGFISLGFLVLLFPKLLLMSLFSNYSFAYQAYSRGDLLFKILDIIKYFGLGTVIVCLLGVLFVRKYIYVVGWFLVTLGIFFLVQNMGIQHKYLLCIPLYILISICVLKALKKNKKVVCCIIFLYLSINTLYSYNMIDYNKLGVIFSNYQSKSLIRNDIDELRLLDYFLKDICGDTKKAYVISSSMILNSDILYKLNYPTEVPQYLSDTAHVDLRDGFPSSFLTSDVIVVASPIQYHLLPEDQRVIGILADEFLSNKKISKRFKKIKEFYLDDNVIVYIYEKNSQFDESDITYLENRFNQYYDEYPILFSDRITL